MSPAIAVMCVAALLVVAGCLTAMAADLWIARRSEVRRRYIVEYRRTHGGADPV